MLLGSSGWAQAPATKPATRPTTAPAPASKLSKVVAGYGASINGGETAEARQGWPLLISATGPLAAPHAEAALPAAPLPPRTEFIGGDGKAVPWTLKPLHAAAGRYSWAVAPEQTQSATPGDYTFVVQFGKGAAAKSATARLEIIPASQPPTPAQPPPGCWRYVGGKDSTTGEPPACGYDLRATPDRCPECGRISAT